MWVSATGRKWEKERVWRQEADICYVLAFGLGTLHKLSFLSLHAQAGRYHLYFTCGEIAQGQLA